MPAAVTGRGNVTRGVHQGQIKSTAKTSSPEPSWLSARCTAEPALSCSPAPAPRSGGNTAKQKQGLQTDQTVFSTLTNVKTLEAVSEHHALSRGSLLKQLGERWWTKALSCTAGALRVACQQQQQLCFASSDSNSSNAVRPLQQDRT